MDGSNPRKRPRPVVSCLRCRDKKLKCDRTSPCENCIKAQIPDTCTFQRNASVSSKESPPVSTVTASAVEELQSRLAKVEELLGIRSSKPVKAAEDAKPHAIGTVVVKGSRSIFHGQNDRTTLLNQVRASSRTHPRIFLPITRDCAAQQSAQDKPSLLAPEH
jgi:hypothetical protein